MWRVRILLDYRPALRERTGVGEYVHQLAAALARQRIDRSTERRAGDRRASLNADAVEIFTSSWSDRPSASALHDLGTQVGVVDRRVPVRLLNYLWHRLEWPPVEWLTGHRYDVVHSPHPLLMPARHGARVVTIHDLDFLRHPERTAAEVRRDYATLAADHARRADAVLVPSQHVADQVCEVLGVGHDRITVTPEGVPAWTAGSRPFPGNPGGGYLLFLGTLEPRKNVGGLLDAYTALLAEVPAAPPLVLAGRPTAAAAEWLEAIRRPPLAGHVEHRGYVAPAERQALLSGARLLVLPSFDEGFGLPVLEAMSLGIPVVASSRGALPEVAGGAALLANPDDPEAVCRALRRVLDEPALARDLGEKGLARASAFSWTRTAELTREAYERAAAMSPGREAR